MPQQAVVNIVDAVLAAVLCVFAARGYVKGLFREVFALLGLALGLIVSFQYYAPLSLWFDSWPYSPLILQGIVFIALFFPVFIALNWMGFTLHRSANRLFLGGFDRLGGLLAGGSKGALLLGVGLFLSVSQAWFPQNLQQEFGKATLAPPLVGFGAWVAARAAAVTSPDATGPGPTPGGPQRGA